MQEYVPFAKIMRYSERKFVKKMLDLDITFYLEEHIAVDFVIQLEHAAVTVK